MYKTRDSIEKSKIAEIIRRLSTQCQCGRYVYIDRKVNKTLCKWCGHYVYNKRYEFREEMLRRLSDV